MMLSKEILVKLEAYNKTVRADDPRFRRSVVVIHEDGTALSFNYAFALMLEDDNQDWVAVFTEHHEWHYFAMGDLTEVRQCEEIRIDRITDELG